MCCKFGQTGGIKTCARERGIEEYQRGVARSPGSAGIRATTAVDAVDSDEKSRHSGGFSGSGKRGEGRGDHDAFYRHGMATNWVGIQRNLEGE
jgi:hypothetical protein